MILFVYGKIQSCFVKVINYAKNFTVLYNCCFKHVYACVYDFVLFTFLFKNLQLSATQQKNAMMNKHSDLPVITLF